MTREQFEQMQIGDKVMHSFGGVGTVVAKYNGGYTLHDEGFDQGDGNCEVNFAWNEGCLLDKGVRDYRLYNPYARAREEAIRNLHIKHRVYKNCKNLAEEYQLILQKKSKLPRVERDYIVNLFESKNGSKTE